MRAMESSPRPWTAIETDDGWMVEDAEGEVVVTGWGGEEGKEIAYLVAASPDILEALNMTRNFMRDKLKIDDDEAYNGPYSGSWKAACAGLAKAIPEGAT